MKRAHNTVDTELTGNDKKLKTSATELVQHFPSELWHQILSKPSVPISILLPFRTVCQSWNKCILSFSKLEIPEKIICQPQLFGLFPNLKTLFMDLLLFKSKWFVPNQMTQLKKLVLFNWDSYIDHHRIDGDEEDHEWRLRFSNLTQLEVLSTKEYIDPTILEKLTNLRKLTVSLGTDDDDKNRQYLTPLTNLTSLYGYEFHDHLGARNFQNHPTLKNMKFNDNIGGFTQNHATIQLGASKSPGMMFRTKRVINCYEMYDGEWDLEYYHGRGSVWYPYWKQDDDNAEGPYASKYELPTSNSDKPSWCRMDPRGEDYYGTQWVHDQEMKRENWICYYDGHWEHQAKHGEGTFFFKDGSKWHGTWRMNLSVGNGTFECPDGTMKIGPWEEFQDRYPVVVDFWDKPR